jgi:hypothetical protein
VDELHLVGDSSGRGSILEGLLTKVMYMQGGHEQGMHFRLIQGASVNRAILQHCFFLVRQHWGRCRYRHFAANFKAF